MKASNFLFPLFVVSLGIVWLAVAALPPTDPVDGFQLRRFAMIPVQENGRLMPFDTYARTKLMFLSHWQSVDLEIIDPTERRLLDKREDGNLTPAEAKKLAQIEADKKDTKVPTRNIPAHEWALDAILLRKKVDNPILDMHMVRIDNDQLLAMLDLKKSPQFGFYFKIADFIGNKELNDRFRQILANGGPRKGDLLESKIAQLFEKVGVIDKLAKFDVPFLVPPRVDRVRGENVADATWMSISSAFEQAHLANPKVLDGVEHAFTAYAKGDVQGFNRSVDAYLKVLEEEFPNVMAKMRTEIRFNNFAPYFQCMVLFVAALILAISSWMVWHKPLRYAAWSLGVLTMIVYTWTLFVRIQISGYAPVTNLYSSAIFIGWGCAGLCLLLELILRNGIGTVVSTVTGTLALIIAHNLLDGDSMGKVVAVLESNFWLSTHVICITFGYTATFVAGFLGICYIGLGIFTPLLRHKESILLGKVLYGVICFAMFLSFVGTVLGGIWADQSWGRFWGWDPKENGALMIVIWNALILHARWAGLVKTRGMAMLAIFGNAVTAWSWFGTNFLGVGLHAYGFAEGGQARIFFFALSQCLLIALAAAVPLKMWRSFRPEST
jgi:ABC-type transport system involved in cytochrome c biogenesis permease subunit